MPLTDAKTDQTTALSLLRTLVDGLTRSARGIESATGLTNAQLFLLRQLAQAGPLSVNELAERMHARQNTVSSVLKRLIESDLVSRAVARTDARRAVLSLTPRGRKVERKAPRPPAEMLIHALDVMPAKTTRALVAGLHALVNALELPQDKAPMLFDRPAPRRVRRGAS